MSNVTFTDPRTSATYSWPKNPASENAFGKTINIERTSNTGNVGATKQQGDDGPVILDWTINVLTTAMETELWQWYVLSKKQTIYVTDWDGEEWEGQIIALTRQRIAEPIAGRIDYMVYDFQFEVYNLISGPLATAGVTP